MKSVATNHDFQEPSHHHAQRAPAMVNSDYPIHTYSFAQDRQSPMRTKRRQVKNACTSCQKACKKCDDVRPCLRCVKYGISETCVDSTRKERKKGIKRGPYKKRDGKGRAGIQDMHTFNDSSPLQCADGSPSSAGGSPSGMIQYFSQPEQHQHPPPHTLDTYYHPYPPSTSKASSSLLVPYYSSGHEEASMSQPGHQMHHTGAGPQNHPHYQHYAPSFDVYAPYAPYTIQEEPDVGSSAQYIDYRTRSNGIGHHHGR